MANSGTITTTERSREMLALRHISARECVVCHGPMSGTRRRRYCSVACSCLAYRQRKLTLASPGNNGGDPGYTGAASGLSDT